jgi:acetylornithine deacetylase/succinyl-diaminopimelate desuccinylase-like protein
MIVSILPGWLQQQCRSYFDQIWKVLTCTRIFVPCRDGVSHNPAEYCSPEDCGNGTQVLLGAMLRYDRLRAGINA